MLQQVAYQAAQPASFPWYITTMIGAGVSAVVAFVIAGYRWMDQTSASFKMLMDNHLPHIQTACEKTATGVADLKTAIELHDAHEEAHFEILKDRLAQ